MSTRRLISFIICLSTCSRCLAISYSFPMSSGKVATFRAEIGVDRDKPWMHILHGQHCSALACPVFRLLIASTRSRLFSHVTPNSARS